MDALSERWGHPQTAKPPKTIAVEWAPGRLKQGCILRVKGTCTALEPPAERLGPRRGQVGRSGGRHPFGQGFPVTPVTLLGLCQAPGTGQAAFLPRPHRTLQRPTPTPTPTQVLPPLPEKEVGLNRRLHLGGQHHSTFPGPSPGRTRGVALLPARIARAKGHVSSPPVLPQQGLCG